MLNQRYAITPGPEHLHAIILGINHLIEQQYAQKLTDGQFEELGNILGMVHKRGSDASIIPWDDNFRSSGGGYISETLGSSLGNKLTDGYELFKKDPTGPMQMFVDYILDVTAETDEWGMPLVFLSLDENKQKHIAYRINEVLHGNIKVHRKEELEALKEKLQ